MAEVRLKDVRKIFDKDVVAVDDANIEIADKEFVVLVGPSGCGKSTTLRMIAGLEEITSGEIYIDGQLVNEVPPKDRDIAMVFQNYALYPHMTVYQNMAFGLKLRKYPKDESKHGFEKRPRSWESRSCSSANRRRFPADSGNGSPLDGPSSASPRCFCSTSPFPISMPSCGCRCGQRSASCILGSRPR